MKEKRKGITKQKNREKKREATPGSLLDAYS